MKMSYDQNVRVSICVITYKHADFIKDTIEGVLMQDFEFPIEFIIADDNSPDQTEKIVRDYIENHSKGNLIKYTKHSENKGMMGNFIWALEQCNGKYIAFCEGDDYWTDSLKLQKQYNAILAHSDVSLVTCNVDHIENGKVIGSGIGGLRTFFFPNIEEVSNMSNYSNFIYHGDNFLKSILATQGKELILEDKMAVWRKHEGGVWGSLLDSKENKRKLEFQRASTSFWIGVYHYDQGRKNIAIKFIVKAILKIMIAIPELEIQLLFSFYKKSLRRLISKVIRK